MSVVFETSLGNFEVELFEKEAPISAKNFQEYVDEGFFDGVIFHRVIPGFMIQGGDPSGTGEGGPGYTLKAEFNETPHDRGVLSMARTNDPDSAGSQFFVMHGRAVSSTDWGLDPEVVRLEKEISSLTARYREAFQRRFGERLSALPPRALGDFFTLLLSQICFEEVQPVRRQWAHNQ